MATTWDIQIMGPFQLRFLRAQVKSCVRVPSEFSTTTMSSHSALFVPSDVGENSTPTGYTSRSCFSTQA